MIIDHVYFYFIIKIVSSTISISFHFIISLFFVDLNLMTQLSFFFFRLLSGYFHGHNFSINKLCKNNKMENIGLF